MEYNISVRDKGIAGTNRDTSFCLSFREQDVPQRIPPNYFLDKNQSIGFLTRFSRRSFLSETFPICS